MGFSDSISIYVNGHEDNANFYFSQVFYTFFYFSVLLFSCRAIRFSVNIWLKCCYDLNEVNRNKFF